jgi:hypothetical protein
MHRSELSRKSLVSEEDTPGVGSAVRRVLVFSTSFVYNCNNIYKLLGKRSDVGEAATAEERNESENPDLRYRDGSEEGGGEGLQACYRTLAERSLCLFPGWRYPSAGCARSQSLGY